MAGRKPIPTGLKVIKGTFRKGRAKDEAQPARAIPEFPEQLSPVAKLEWDRITPDLFRLGLLSRIDRAALSAYCEAWADYIDATEKVNRHGKIIKTAEKITEKPDGTIEKSGGNMIENPYFTIKKRSADIMHKFLVEFGLTPASRSRINAMKDAEGGHQQNDWSNFG